MTFLSSVKNNNITAKRTRWDGRKHHAQASRASYQLLNRIRTRIISDNTLSYTKGFVNHEILNSPISPILKNHSISKLYSVCDLDWK